jgi:RNA polymerase sigma-70 factor (ECF subfamily)
LEGLYDRYSGAVYSLAVYMLQDAGAAEEVMQDTFFKVWRKGSSYNPERGKVTSWLFSIAHHRVIDEVRRRRRRDRNQVFQDVDLIDQPADDSSDPTRYAMVQMRRSRIKTALSALRPEQREVVVLAYYGGLTHSEMAKRLGLPLGTVKTRMRLALRKLKEVLESRVRELMDYGL